MIWTRLSRFYERCGASGLPELERLANTVSAWWPEILAFLDTGITNAGSEGTNRVIKTVARDATQSANDSAPAAPPPAKDEASSTPHNFDEPLVTAITCPAYLTPSVRSDGGDGTQRRLCPTSMR